MIKKKGAANIKPSPKSKSQQILGFFNLDDNKKRKRHVDNDDLPQTVAII